MHRGISFLILPLLLAAMLLGACEDSVNPILESNRNFTLFGTLDMNQDTQYVRVVPIRPTLLPQPGQEVAITFTSQDLTSGEVTVWQDSIVTFANGATGLVFYTPARIRPGRRYRIEVTSPSLELVTSAETTAPSLPTEVVVMPEVITGGVGGAIAEGQQEIRWVGVADDPFRIDLWYRFLPAEQGRFQDVMIPYEPRNEPAGNAWNVILDLRQDRRTLDTLVNLEEVPLAGVGLLMTVLDDQFVPPGGVFDPDVLSQPGTFSNVENGFGFIGSVGRFAVEWTLEEESMDRLNYLSIEDAFGKRAPEVLPADVSLPQHAIRVPVRVLQ